MLVLVVVLAGAGAVVHAAPDPEVEAIQRALVERGFDPGKIDGAMGWRTRGAIRVFQRSSGLPDTGRADTATLEALGLVSPDGGEARAETETPQTGTPGTETEPRPSPGTPKAETPDVEPATDPGVDASGSESPPAVPAPIPRSEAPAAATPDTKPSTEPDVGAPESESPAAVPAPIPRADPPTAETPDATPDTAAPETGTPRAEPAPGPGTVSPKAQKPSVTPATKPLADTPKSETRPARPAPKPAVKPKPATKTKPAANPKLSYSALGWHRPQTGGEALERFTEIGGPRDFKRGTSSLFVPKSELVFVLKAGERIPGFDCDPGAGRLSIEFVFGPDGPVIFTPEAGSGYCQMGIGIAIAVGRPLELRRVDWGDDQYRHGTVRVTNEGLEYIR